MTKKEKPALLLAQQDRQNGNVTGQAAIPTTILPRARGRFQGSCFRGEKMASIFKTWCESQAGRRGKSGSKSTENGGVTFRLSVTAKTAIFFPAIRRSEQPVCVLCVIVQVRFWPRLKPSKGIWHTSKGKSK